MELYSFVCFRSVSMGKLMLLIIPVNGSFVFRSCERVLSALCGWIFSSGNGQVTECGFGQWMLFGSVWN